MPESQLVGSEAVYTVRARGDVIEKLKMMEKARSILTVSVGGDDYKFGTIIVKVVTEKGMVALDLGANPATTQRVLEASFIRCETHVNGVEARFELKGMCAATLGGAELIAAEIPEELFWFQRRSFYRVVVPASRFIKCRVTLPNDEMADFPVHNLSLVGMALLDKSGLLWQWGRPGQTFGPCRLRTPGFEDEEFALEVKNKVETTQLADYRANMRIGLAFREIGRNFEIQLQKLIFELERELRRESDGPFR